MTRSTSTVNAGPALASASTRLLRVDPATVIIFSVLLSPLLFVAGLLAWRGQQLRDAVFLGAAYVAALYWICGRTIELAPGRLVYRVLLTRRNIELSMVRAARVVARPAPTLELMQEGSQEYTTAFIVKPFTKSGIAAILHHIRACSPEVELDPVALDMADGRFDSITREAIRAMNVLRRVLLLAFLLIAAVVVRLVLR